MAAGAAAYVAIDVLHYDIAPQDRLGGSGLAVFAAWIAVTAAMIVLFQRRRPDLFGLATAVLGIIVVIRTVLSFALQIEIEGTLPWRRALTTTAPQLIARTVKDLD